MPETKRTLRVFLCHAHSDAATVRDLYLRLTKDGVDAWLDKEKLLPGQDWELEIRKAVRESNVVVVCLSKQFNQAGFRQKEVRLALDTAMEQQEGEIFIIPARLDECDSLESLRKWHWVDLFEDDGYARLIRALRTRADKLGITLRIRKNRTQKIRKPNEVSGTEKDPNTFEPININSNSVIKTSKLEQEAQAENVRIEKNEIKKRRLPYFETPKARKSENISLDASSAQQEFFRKSKTKRQIKTEYLVAIIGAVATIIAGFLSSPLIERWFSPASVPNVSASATAPVAELSPAINPSETVEPNQVPTEVIERNPTSPTEITDPKGVQMVLVPGGDFIMGREDGNADEKPVHNVYLDAFYIDIYEVTNASYKTCVDAGVCSLPKDYRSFTRPEYYDNPNYKNYPVIYVNWNMAQIYCEWRSGSLPSEAQWEKAARGNDGLLYPWGEGISCDHANYKGCVGDTSEVGIYSEGASSYGIYDMAGNVWEWTVDWYNAYPGADIAGLKEYGQVFRVLRGGSYYTPIPNLQSTNRWRVAPADFNDNIGFRCARFP